MLSSLNSNITSWQVIRTLTTRAYFSKAYRLVTSSGHGHTGLVQVAYNLLFPNPPACIQAHTRLPGAELLGAARYQVGSLCCSAADTYAPYYCHTANVPQESPDACPELLCMQAHTSVQPCRCGMPAPCGMNSAGVCFLHNRTAPTVEHVLWQGGHCGAVPGSSQAGQLYCSPGSAR